MDLLWTLGAGAAAAVVGLALGYRLGWSEYQQWFGQRYGAHPEQIAKHCNRLLKGEA